MRTEWAYFDVLLAALAGWMNERQQRAIDYLLEENRVLRGQIGKRRMSLSDDQRRRLATKGKAIGRVMLERLATICSPETILAWHRRLVRKKWTKRAPRAGRPRTMKAITELIVRFATENPRWGYRRIQGALKNVGHCVSVTTIRSILKSRGLEPAPDRHSTWRTFLRAHAAVIAAADFFTTEVWTARGLVTHYTLFMIDHATRAVEILGTTPHPTAEFMMQAARNATDSTDGFLRAKRYLIIDRDTLYTAEFKSTLASAGIEASPTPPSSPDCNAIAERFVRSIKSECVERFVFFGADSLRRALDAYVAHYNAERKHQGISNALIASTVPVGGTLGRIRKRERLGGLLNFYHRSAA